MLSALDWVPKGASKPIPIFEQVADLENLENDAENDENDEDEEISEVQVSNEVDEDEDLKKYNLDTYDEEDVEDGFDEALGLTDLTYYKDNTEDPYLKEDEEDEELEDFIIRETDAVLIGTHSEEEVSHLDVYVYEEDQDNLYVHHDILLPTFPLCLTWLDYHPGNEEKKGSLVAVGTFEPEIELYDLDTIGLVQPTLTLGGYKKSKKKNKELKENSHSDSIMSLCWNSNVRTVIASGSADCTIKVWDIEKKTCLTTLSHHTDKVQCVQWHNKEAAILLSGSYDKHCAVLDPRFPNAVNKVATTSEIESVCWNFHNTNQFMVSGEDGIVNSFDIRNLNKPVWTLSAHNKAVSSVKCNPILPNLIATGSLDKSIKLWDISEQYPKLLTTIRTNFGVFSISFYSASPFLLAAGGQDKDHSEDPTDRLHVYNTFTLDPVQSKFSSYNK